MSKKDLSKNLYQIGIDAKSPLLQSDVNSMVALCFGLSFNAGWHNEDINAPGVTPTKLCLIHSEISEAMEGYRKNLNDDHLPARKMFEVELADAVIRIFDLAGAHGLDLGGAISDKMAYNQSRADHKPENRNAQNGKKF